jgi:hypothetical protein
MRPHTSDSGSIAGGGDCRQITDSRGCFSRLPDHVEWPGWRRMGRRTRSGASPTLAAFHLFSSWSSASQCKQSRQRWRFVSRSRPSAVFAHPARTARIDRSRRGRPQCKSVFSVPRSRLAPGIRCRETRRGSLDEVFVVFDVICLDEDVATRQNSCCGNDSV